MTERKMVRLQRGRLKGKRKRFEDVKSGKREEEMAEKIENKEQETEERELTRRAMIQSLNDPESIVKWAGHENVGLC